MTGRFGSAFPRPRRSQVEQALHQLVRSSDARLESMLTIPVEFAKSSLFADSATLSQWDGDTLQILAEIGTNKGPISGRIDRLESLGDNAHWQSWHQSATREAPRLATDATGASVFELPLHVDDRRWGLLRLTRVGTPFDADELPSAIQVIRDVEGMISAAERLQVMARMALEDPLTGLSNRRAFEDALAEQLRPGGAGATVVMCDINHLKFINDEFGHLAGDRAIIDTAQGLASAAAPIPGSIVARLGGDEFAVMLPGAVRSAAIALVAEAAKSLSASEHRVTISSGVAVTPAGLSITKALGQADDAQYAAKSRGALLVVATTASADPDDPDQASDRIELVDPATGPIPRITNPSAVRRRERRQTPRRASDQRETTVGTAVLIAHLVAEVAEQLLEPKPTVGQALRWLGERMLVPFDLAEWAVSRVDFTGDRLVCTDSMGINGATFGLDRYDDQVDSTFAVDDFPLTLAASAEAGWFAVDRTHPDCDPGERSVLEIMGMTQMVAIGCPEGERGWLLELYGRRRDHDLRAMGQAISVCGSALLGRPIGEVIAGAPGYSHD